MKATRLYLLLIGLCLLPACNLPSAATAEATPTAERPTVLPTAAAFLAPTRTPTALPPTATPFPTLDPSGPPIATALTQVACRAGPTNEYPLIAHLNAGQSVAIVGKAYAHWIVKPDAADECWVDAGSVAVRGATASLPDYPPPPLPVSGPPGAPTNLKKVGAVCTAVPAKPPPLHPTEVFKFKIEFLLAWEDKSDNEDGFYVYRDSRRVAIVPANTAQLLDSFFIRSGGDKFHYYVVAYNSAGQTQGGGVWIFTPCPRAAPFPNLPITLRQETV